MKLLYGSRSFSSWSLRPWLALKVTGLPFEEQVIPFGTEGYRAEIQRLSPSKTVPVLFDGDLILPDSLAIIEYVHELAPNAGLYPTDIKRRAALRAATAEMHSSFPGLRGECPMNLRRKGEPPKAGFSDQCLADVARIEALWAELRAANRSGGPFLGGKFGAADCMFAPVVTRMVSYGITIGEETRAYADLVLAHDAMREWYRLAESETENYASTEDL